MVGKKGEIKLVRLGCFLFYSPNHNLSKIVRKQDIKSCVSKDYLVLCVSLLVRERGSGEDFICNQLGSLLLQSDAIRT